MLFLIFNPLSCTLQRRWWVCPAQSEFRLLPYETHRTGGGNVKSIGCTYRFFKHCDGGDGHRRSLRATGYQPAGRWLSGFLDKSLGDQAQRPGGIPVSYAFAAAISTQRLSQTVEDNGQNHDPNATNGGQTHIQTTNTA
ncbi:hypothetical protein DJ39_2363 [Yersinia ruckeri ATCC 29473]|uniref:Uncharacterized protein n=1 Tax=Yersinia ruckeri TaxID=29486 RepID=A0A380QSD0_YERRU|nr:hypothetical protein QMA0440_00730 [Yersinia ruckeri]KGA51373.1 hypothetical protein DJ39_2363 [Yersinia ruckeri ATCC 29473]KFE38552.1 glycine betaine transporter membrane protein [Yersinia ruckeri]CNB46063.1 Uncharacterised protein [Yersinia ruckeri]CNI52664.1 Uncharacterised protein [Yersinia ruckeri]